MNEINVGEVYYVTAKRRSQALAEEVLQRLESLPIKILSNSFPLVIEAARIKARFPIPYADAFAVATAIDQDAVLVSGDPEFRKVEGLVSIDWL